MFLKVNCSKSFLHRLTKSHPWCTPNVFPSKLYDRCTRFGQKIQLCSLFILYTPEKVICQLRTVIRVLYRNGGLVEKGGFIECALRAKSVSVYGFPGAFGITWMFTYAKPKAICEKYIGNVRSSKLAANL